jgi:hypothetical protein
MPFYKRNISKCNFLPDDVYIDLKYKSQISLIAFFSPIPGAEV